MATLQNLGVLKYRDKDGQWHPLPVVLQSSDGGGSGGISTISGNGQPTESTVGQLNQLYRDESTDKLYICTGVEGGYTWSAVVSDTEDAVTYTAQTLTDEQKTQARANIGAGTSNFSGLYNDLPDKPNIPAATVIDTTLTKSGQAADAKAVGDAIDKKIDAPQTAQVGEALTVEEVDAEGKPKKWKTQMIDAGYDTILAAIDQAVFDKQLLVDILAGTCENLTGDSITAVADYVFYIRSSLKTVDLPNCISIGSYTFYNCNALTTVNLPMVTSIGTQTFQVCSALTTANFPMARSLGNGAFRNCSALTTANLPMVTSIGAQTFQLCSALTTANLPMVTSIQKQAFSGCYSLTALVLGGTDVCYLSNTSVFDNCYHILGITNSTYNPTGSKDGYIYVPDDLVDSYKSTKNWTTYASQIKPLSEYAGVV